MALEAVVFPRGHHLFVQSSREQQLCAMPFGGGGWGIHDDGLGDSSRAEMDAQDISRPLPQECGEDGTRGIEVGVAGDLSAVGEMCCQEVGAVANRELLFDGLQGCWADACRGGGFEDWTMMDGSSPEMAVVDHEEQVHLAAAAVSAATPPPASCRRKRRRTKRCKNQEEVENQRMTHIAVERNRRKQMNEYLSVLRSLMPTSYVQRGDQASIIGGAINYVKELEQLLQSLEAQKCLQPQSAAPEATDAAGSGGSTGGSSAFAGFFTFPQYSTCSSSQNMAATKTNSVTATNNNTHSSNSSTNKEGAPEKRSAVADIEVTMVESHANLKVLSRRRPRQLIKVVMGLQNLRLTTLHLNVTTVEQMVLYSFSLKVEDDCQLTSVDEIAAAVYQMLGKIQDESGFS